MYLCFFFLMIRRPPRSTQSRSSAASDVYKRQIKYCAITLAKTYIIQININCRSNSYSRRSCGCTTKSIAGSYSIGAVSYTHLRAHETPEHLVCRLLLEKKKICPYLPLQSNHVQNHSPLNHNVLFFTVLLLSISAKSQSENDPYTIEIERIYIPGSPAIHSFAFAESNGKWLFAGGRTNGLHGFNPGDAFPKQYSNKNIFVVNPNTLETFSKNIFSDCSYNTADPLRSTNMQQIQLGVGY